jgi:two-component system, NtrC family, sensor histidine kinase HydH
MLAWFKARYRAFQSSYDPDEAAAASSPLIIAILAAALIGPILVIGYVPTIAASAQLRRPWVAVVIVMIGALTSYISVKHHCRGPIGTAATLLDNMWWFFAIVYLAVNTTEGYAIGFSIAYALVVSLVTTRIYGLTVLLAVVLMLPVVVLVPWFKPPATTELILWATAILSLTLSYMNGKRQALLRRHRKLERALSLADEVADESMQAALATMLLSLGHFLHELRNYQTAIATNLSYLQTVGQFGDDAREALKDIQVAQAAEQKLVAHTLEELRQRANPEISTFELKEVLAKVAADVGSIGHVTVSGGDAAYLLVGNPEHLRLVVHNLARNATQAGAKNVHLDVKVDSSGEFVSLVVHDDGPGIAPSRRATLFEPFLNSSKLNGTGLGLYLCRRYVGLFGGTVTVGDGPLGGAAFTIQLPGRAAYRNSVLVELSKKPQKD